ncbi:MAG TPA: hypothetical protein RMH99_17065 [Sandaracinaceae bacterium LLY-WYZ-13_1]|nr:hypothetical protein [Sandaracinaceae bacterium LLY-WYZ-13_1]
MTRAATVLLSTLLLAGCLGGPDGLPPDADPPDALDELGPRVRLLAIPRQESGIELLGASVEPGTDVPDPSRRLVVPEMSASSAETRYEGLRELSIEGGIVVGDDLATFGHGQITHLSYEIDLEGTIELDERPRYDLTSGCCAADGSVAPACAGGYVRRLLVGDATIRYLRAASAEGSLEGPVETHAGVRYRVMIERSFRDSIFAIDVVPAAPVCEMAFCAARGPRGACLRCEVTAGQLDSPSMHAPAASVLRLVCDEMPGRADATITLRGELSVAECPDYHEDDVTIGVDIESEGAEAKRVEVPVQTLDESEPWRLSVEVPDVHATSDGLLTASVHLRECVCEDGSPGRCRFSEDTVLAVREATAW